MEISSTNLIIRETKENAMAKVGAVNSAATNGTNNNTANNNAVDQSKVVKTDTVELSQKSVELATTTQNDSGLQIAVTKEAAMEDRSKDREQAMKESQHELKSLVKSLKHAGVSKAEVKSIIKAANRAVNKTIGNELRQAYNDYRGDKISKSEFKDQLYGAAVKKLDSIVTALKDKLAQKTAPEDKSTEAVKEVANETKSHEATKATHETKVSDADEASEANAEKSAEAAKESAHETRSDEATKSTKETRITDADDAAKKAAKENTEKTKEKSNETSEKEVKATPPGVAKGPAGPVGPGKPGGKGIKTENGNLVKAEKAAEKKEGVGNSGKGKGLGIGNGISGSGLGPINANENADNAFGQLVSFFNEIDKMINGLADEAEGKDNVDKDKGDSLINFASKLSDMFSGINKAFGRQEDENVGNKLGMAQMNKETIGQLFDSGHGSGAINRIGDAGEGTGNFNTANFMSSMSSGINDALDSYKDVMKAEKEAKEEAAQEQVAQEETVGV